MSIPASDADAKRIVHYPSIEFTAFHPDMVYVLRTASGSDFTLKSPVGDYHSALVFFCYSVGLNAEQTAARFKEQVLARLGYFADALWSAAERNVLSSGRAAGLPVDRLFRSWLRRGCFMHSPNHPKLFVLADLAAAALSSCGVSADARLCEDYVPDDMKLGPIWPIYPEIAVKFGLDGSYCYKGVPSSNGIAPYFNLREFVEASFAVYREHSLSDMLCPRVEAWKADTDLVNYILGNTNSNRVEHSKETGSGMPAADGTSRGLPCESNIIWCALDWINSVLAGTAREVSVRFGDSTMFEGWAADAQGGTLAGGVDVVIDGIPYRASYGRTREDVAQACSNPALRDSGFQFTLAPGALNRGSHSFTIRVIALSGQTYYEGPSGRLIVE